VGVLLVDAANVVGSRPDGWWRDRAGAAARLVAALRAAALGPVVVVLEGAARPGAPEGEDGGVRVVHAPADGDATLAALCRPGVTLVTADRGLRARARAAGADVTGPSALLDRLRTPG
jgi:hypothetical protein